MNIDSSSEVIGNMIQMRELMYVCNEYLIIEVIIPKTSNKKMVL